MHHKLLGVLFSAALLVSAAYAADDKDKKDQDKYKGSTEQSATQPDADKRDPSKSSMEQTQDTKTRASARTTKKKTETVIGEVMSYEAGKSIEVSTPGKMKQNRTFDLSASDMTVNVDPSVAVGARVKVTQKTDKEGRTTLTVEPYKKQHASAPEKPKPEKEKEP